MELFDKNLKTLNRYYPQMDKLIEKGRQEISEDLEILEEPAYDGSVSLAVKKDGRLLYLNGIRNTVEPAQLWVKTLGKLERNAPVFLMGTGNETYLKEVSEQNENKITIIVYEPSLKIFLKFLERVDLEPIMEKHTVVFFVKGLDGMDMEHIQSMLTQILKYEMLCYIKYFIVPNYDLLFADDAVQYTKMCCDISYNALVSWNTNNTFTPVMAKNLLSNARYLPDGYKTTQLVEIIPQDIPGILVAAGPSLNKNIEELKKAKGKAFIIAVDTAIKPLLAAGIVPDMFAIIDALKPLDLVQIEGVRNIPLVTTLNAASEILEYHTGMKFFFNEGYQFAERIFLKTGKQVGTVSSGGSVATTAFSLLYKINLDTIILVGQDLAYTNNKSHADGTFKSTMDEVDTSQFLMVEGNYEDKVPTRGDFKLFLDWYEEYIAKCKKRKPKLRVINATEGGAKIPGTEIMTLKDAIAQTCRKEFDCKKQFDSLPHMLDECGRNWTQSYLYGLADEYQAMKKEAHRIKKSYQKLDKICARKNMDTTEYLNLLKKLERQIKEIERKSPYQLIDISLNNAKFILKSEQFMQETTTQAEGREVAHKGIFYMDQVAECADVLSEYARELFSCFAPEEGVV